MKVACDESGIKKAVDAIKKGGIVVFPTDTVYGIGCDPFNEKSVEEIYKIKKRDIKKRFPILGHKKTDLEKIVKFDVTSNKIAEKFWPGKVTLIVEVTDEKIKESLGAGKKIGVRVPDNLCVQKILGVVKLLIGTSANISGESSYTDPDECLQKLNGIDVFVDGGKIDSKGESTIVECDGDNIVIHREGSVSKEEIMSIR